MQAKEANFLQFLQKDTQFVIPIYQRTYSWTQKECKQFWDDIVRVATKEDVPSHFVGSIVYIKSGIYQVSTISRLLVIDGQQRLTTLSILLIALGEIIEETEKETGITLRKIRNYYLLNSEEEENLRYKLILTQSDKNILKELIKGNKRPFNEPHHIIENYKFFRKQIEDSKITIDTLITGIQKLVIVDVSLDRTQDNPQLIFESLNSTGLDLSQADLIRNFILMGLETDQQTKLYQEYWFPMEQSFGRKEYSRYFDRFMRDYLTIKNKGAIPRIKEVYEEFKIFVGAQPDLSIDHIVSDIYRYSKHFVKLAFLVEEDKKIREILSDINSLRVDVAYPLLIEIFDDYDKGLITRGELTQVLELVESYVFRRAICGIPTNSLNKTFANFSKEIDKEKYLESLFAAFLLKDTYRRFPSDEEFQREFVTKDVYNFRSRNFLLRKLENDERKEIVKIEEYTFEHIMPQNENLSNKWKEELGENWQHLHEKYLHTIGNLTLTGYNPELSDRPFIEKRNIAGGFADSPIRLNRKLAKLEHWDEGQIQKRAKELAAQAVKIWSAPKLPIEVLNQYKLKKSPRAGEQYSINDYKYLEGDMLHLYQQLKRQILNLDSSVKEEFKQQYIAFKTTTNFVDIVPQKNQLQLIFNMTFPEIDDPRGICKDKTGKGLWGNGDILVGISSSEKIEYIMFLIRQSFEKHWDGGNEQLF